MSNTPDLDELQAQLRALTAARDENARRISELRDQLFQRPNYQSDVEQFMRGMNQNVPSRPTLDAYPFELRAKLILEEAHEFVRACGLGITVGSTARGHESTVSTTCPRHAEDWPEMIDALCDLLYVTFGAASAMGVDLKPYFDEVHSANMKKTAGPVREDGKRLKPEGWQPPRIAELLKDDLQRVHHATDEEAGRFQIGDGTATLDMLRALEIMRHNLQVTASFVTESKYDSVCQTCTSAGDDEDEDEICDEEACAMKRFIRAFRKSVDPDDVRVVVRQLEHAAGIIALDELK